LQLPNRRLKESQGDLAGRKSGRGIDKNLRTRNKALGPEELGKDPKRGGKKVPLWGEADRNGHQGSNKETGD